MAIRIARAQADKLSIYSRIPAAAFFYAFARFIGLRVLLRWDFIYKGALLYIDCLMMMIILLL